MKTTKTKTQQPTTPAALVSSDLLGQVCRYGEVYRIYSDRFGTHDVLCICVPDRTAEGRYRFVPIQPSGETGEALYKSSVAKDRVEKRWPNLLAYYADALA